jgi:hypothetical protein
MPNGPHIPAYLQQWGPESWKKHFIHYLVDTGKYFVFPRISLTTNFEDYGTHALMATSSRCRFSYRQEHIFSDAGSFGRLL